MSKHALSPGGRAARGLYGIAVGLALFSGMGQMPIYKRYYLTDLPGMAWAGDFIILSDLHYLAAALLLGLLAWRLALDIRAAGGLWSWGPRGWWGWTLLGLLAASGGAKAIYNYGVFIPPALFMLITFIHMGSAMAFMFSGLVSLLMKRKQTLRGLA